MEEKKIEVNGNNTALGGNLETTEHIYSIYDKKMEVFNRPMIEQNLVPILRSLGNIMRDPKSAFANYPEDFAIYKIGEFNHRMGKIIPRLNPELVIEMASLKQEQERE